MFRIIFFYVVYNMTLSSAVNAQTTTLNLQQTIRLAQENSFEYKVAQNRLQSSLWRYESFKASFLPTLYLNGEIPNYSRAISRITLPNGEDTFVSQNQSFSSAHLSVRQNVGFTGGVIAVNSFLNRIDVFGDNRQTHYSSTPLSISYYQENLRYNSFRWQKKTEPLQLELAEKQYASDLERIAEQTVNYFFDLLSAKERLALSRQNLKNIDTLSRITKDRYALGNITQSTLLQLELNSLSAQERIAEDSINYQLTKQQFIRYLRLTESDELEVQLEENVDFFAVPFDAALEAAMANSKNVIDFRIKRLEAEHDLARTKAESGLKFNVNANFGITNIANTLENIFIGVENQQQVSLGISLPIVDWGNAKMNRQRSKANLAMIENEIEQQQLNIQQEIALYTARWTLQQQKFVIAKQTREIANKNHALELERFVRGIITINDLNTSTHQKDNSNNAYIEALRGYWTLYYIIRKLTLFDFQKNYKIAK